MRPSLPTHSRQSWDLLGSACGPKALTELTVGLRGHGLGTMSIPTLCPGPAALNLAGKTQPRAPGKAGMRRGCSSGSEGHSQREKQKFWELHLILSSLFPPFFFFFFIRVDVTARGGTRGVSSGEFVSECSDSKSKHSQRINSPYPN